MDCTPIYRRPLVIVAVVAIFGGVIWFVLLHDRTPAITPDGAKVKATTFLDELRAGRVDDAWAGTSADFKSMYGRDRFRQYVKAKPLLKSPAEFETCEFKREGGLRIVECTFRPTSGKGSIKVVLNVDQGTWKVGKLSVD